MDIFKIGSCYRWIGQKERLIYLGYGLGEDGYCHQFALFHNPSKIWCEVEESDIEYFEEIYDNRP